MSAEEGEQEELNVLFHAVQLGRTDIVKNAVTSLRETKSAEELLAILSEVRPDDGSTLLHIGSAAGHSDVIRALLNTGVDASIVPTDGEYSGKTAYQAAESSVLQAFHVYLFEKIALGEVDVIGNLLDAGIPVELRDSSSIDDSTLHWACSFGNAAVADLLLSRGCPVNILNSSQQTPLHLACKNGSREVLELLLSRGANANMPDSLGKLATELIPLKHSELVEVIDAHIAAHPGQHQAPEKGTPSPAEPEASVDDMSSADPSPDANTAQDISYAQQRPPPVNVSSHLILWPPPQRQRMLPMSAFEDNGDGCNTPEFGIVFSSVRPVLISYATEDKSTGDVGCIAEVCGLTQALKRFGLESVVLRSPATADIRFTVNASLCPGHHRYSINVCPSFISVVGSDKQGLLYGAYTLVQITQLHSEFGVLENDTESLDQSKDDLEFDMNGFSVSTAKKVADVIRTLTIPCVSVEDWPDFPSRGVTWSYNAAALTNVTVLHKMIGMLSKIRLSKLFLYIDGLDYASPSPEYSEAFLSARQRENVLSGSRVYYLERLCRSYMIDIVPVVKVPCCLAVASGTVEPSQKRLNVDALRCFSSSVIHIEFYIDHSAATQATDDAAHAAVSRSCRLALKAIGAAGFASVVIKCSSAFQRLYDPLSAAGHVGLFGVYGDIDSSTDMFTHHALCSHQFVQEAELRCRSDFEQGKTTSIAPGFVDSAILCPLIFVKYICFLHAGFSWNRDTVMDIIGLSNDLQMLEEVINLTLFTEGDGNMLTTSPDVGSSDNGSLNGPKEDALRRTCSANNLNGKDYTTASDECDKEAAGGFLFWRKQISSGDVPPAAGSAPLPQGPTQTHADFVLSILTCNSNSVLHSPRDHQSRGEYKPPPIFEFFDAARSNTSSPMYRNSPNVRAMRARTHSNSLQRPCLTPGSGFGESESILWRFLNAKSFAEFVTCGFTRECARTDDGCVDGYSPTKAQVLEVLKYYRRALASVGWKLDRKKMAALRESGMTSENIGARAQWGAEALSNGNPRSKDGENELFVFENSFPGEEDVPYPSYAGAACWDGAGGTKAKVKRNNGTKKMPSFYENTTPSSSDVHLDIEEIYVVLHLVCTICRAVILGYNAHEKKYGVSDGRKLKFSELISILPTGSTSDIANALLEGIEYSLMLWNRRFERLSFGVKRGKSSCRAVGSNSDRPTVEIDTGPVIPGLGAFYWISQNLPQQVEDLFFNTLTVLQHSS